MANFIVPPISQKTLNLCWEACGHMMWNWKYRNDKAKRAQYAAKAGKYATMNVGLSGAQCDLYYKQLGMRSVSAATGGNLIHAIGWSPVVMSSVAKISGHAMLVIGANGGEYTILNPCAVQVTDFESPTGDTCAAGTYKVPQAKVESELGKYIWYW